MMSTRGRVDARDSSFFAAAGDGVVTVIINIIYDHLGQVVSRIVVVGEHRSKSRSIMRQKRLFLEHILS